MRKRRFKIMIVVLLVALLPLAFLLCERIRGKISLARYKRALVARGEKLTPQDLFPLPPQAENGAPEVLEACKQLKEGIILPKNYPPRMKLTPAGRAIVCFREEDWVEGKVTNHWDQMWEDLERNEDTLKRIRAALEKPILNNR